MEYDLTSRKGIDGISKRIRISYRKLSGGLGDAEDCVQEILVRMYGGRHKHSTIDQAVIDYLRSTYGDSRVYSHDERNNLNFAVSIETGGTSLERLLRNDAGGESLERLNLDECAGWIGNKIDRGCLVLFYKWGLNEAEIGYLFGFSESRVSQRLKRIQKCISARLKIKASRERAGQMEKVLCSEAKGNQRRLEQVQAEGLENIQSWPMESDNETSF